MIVVKFLKMVLDSSTNIIDKNTFIKRKSIFVEKQYNICGNETNYFY